MTPREGLGAVLGIASVLWIVPAWQLIHRTLTEPKYRRRIGLLSWSTLPLAAGGLYFYVSLGGNIWQAIPALLFFVALPFFIRWQRARLTFWCPSPPPKGKLIPRLHAPMKWDALLWAVLYMGLWMAVLGLMD